MNWTDLVATSKAETSEWAADLLERCDEAKELLAEDGQVARTLLGVPSTLTQMAIVDGPASVQNIITAWEPVVHRAIGEIGDDVSANERVIASVVLSFINVSVTCGVSFNTSLDTSMRTVEAEWPRRLAGMAEEMSDRERWLAALAALVAEQPEHAGTIAGGGALPASVTPGEVFDFNTQGFIRYLAVAERVQTPLKHVLPSVENFVARFPYKLQAGMLRFDELLYVGRIAFSRVGHMDEKETGMAMHQLVLQMAS